MKNKIIFILIAVTFLFFSGKAQYKILHSFNDTLGSSPDNSSLLLSGNKFYGTTSAGGPSGYGVVYSIDTTGNNYIVLHYFNNVAGSFPENPLTIGSKLYGIASGGGTHNAGVIFSMDTNGNNYKVLTNFNDTDGEQPIGSSLTLFGKRLYGISSSGGTYNYGTLYSLDTSGSNFKILHVFNDTVGALPWGSVILVNNIIYGTSSDGGINNVGILYSVDTNGNNFRKLYDFASSSGSWPLGSLILVGKKFFGITSGGGNHNCGAVFSIDTNGSNYRDLFDLSASMGCQPGGSLTYDAFTNKLLGTTSGGGSNLYGVLFSIDTTGSNYDVLYNFSVPDGANPNGWLTTIGEKIYGTTTNGRIMNYGVIYSFNDIHLGIIPEGTDNNACHIYPNPNTGLFTIALGSMQNVSVKVTNVLGQAIYSEVYGDITAPSTKQINLQGVSKGVYLLEITSNYGILNKKIIIQ